MYVCFDTWSVGVALCCFLVAAIFSDRDHEDLDLDSHFKDKKNI
ncbi:hypothetical protein HanRHA438_Chr14g0679431 [Helianthus annuus]|uniref:Uncharacterized protein n=1 Tax=Helianthus annuus TaxID=4232 RepID=A0A9K3EDS7_HELAN|nr:hypothetical protein HanXRQr2_Chr14g0667821 [Helianthus annuus]KAJ0466038.1 hypothetical protein HanHA300_Chr14g0544681 [Helianthus annuus]KAJ0487618.1 hypothetical protein HanHA89_Chr14g0592331 [Helianthus annuus]KAJ0658059.1 hypothetical protein HanLR1_Chr14g0553501 [Helianthus annuus]KAJ0661730.1 hypothetical protein HanOQP8_Chr14g0551671 [Helianthus annuus]